jgi:hypothetical protein
MERGGQSRMRLYAVQYLFEGERKTEWFGTRRAALAAIDSILRVFKVPVSLSKQYVDKAYLANLLNGVLNSEIQQHEIMETVYPKGKAR